MSECNLNGAGNGTNDTSNPDGDYLVVNWTKARRFDDTANVDKVIDRIRVNTGSNASEYGFEVAIEDLSASFDEDDVPVTQGDSATLEVDSNRGE